MSRAAPVLLLALAAPAFAADSPLAPDQPNVIGFPAAEARFVRVVIHATTQGQPCIDELEIFGPGGDANLARADAGAKADASSNIAGHAIHQVAHLNDGLYGNAHSWIAAGTEGEWAQIELPRAATVDRVVLSRDREGRYRDRVPAAFEVRLSLDGAAWRTVARRGAVAAWPVPPLPAAPGCGDDLLRYAFACEARSLARTGADPVALALRQMGDLAERLAAQGLDVSAEREELAGLRPRATDLGVSGNDPGAAGEVLFRIRLAKRRLFLRDPGLAPLEKILFVKRHPYAPSHNYSDLFDAQGPPGGGVYLFAIPRPGGRLDPAAGTLAPLVETREGVCRDPVADFDARRIYYSIRETRDGYFHLVSVRPDGSDRRTLTDGPFHDVYPCPLPDGGLAFISTRCRARFLCWRPQASVLFRMDADGGGLRPLSFANLTEWAPAVMRDGRILWTRSEYLDKGADFGHTLWAIRPDGTFPELVFGNNTRFCYAGAREVPGTGELCCTLISHGGDLNGPIALIDTGTTVDNPRAVRSITPDVKPHFHMSWAQRECFRDPVPVGRDLVLCSHAPDDRFGLYVIDRFGNREVLHLDPAVGSMAPTPFRPVPAPPVPGAAAPLTEEGETGRCVVSDVYEGLGPAVPRGTVKWLRICQEVRADLEQLPNGEYAKDHPEFQDWYASPTHKVRGPHGWPSYVAKASLGLVPVEEDGSAHFVAPAGKVIYFQALDARLTEVQRMRSVLQLQRGETRGCVGCHESRLTAPPPRPTTAARRPPSVPAPPPWGAVPFSYEKVVQPVWDARCIRCHDDGPGHAAPDLRGTRDAEKVPASYRTLVEGGWVHYFDYTWGQEHWKAAPLTFGSVKSRLLPFLEPSHHGVALTADERHAVTCWIDLNVPLWPDYLNRLSR